jgi:hypothetical protein
LGHIKHAVIGINKLVADECGRFKEDANHLLPNAATEICYGIIETVVGGFGAVWKKAPLCQ